MNQLLTIIIGILVFFVGVILADREFLDDIRDQRVIALEERLEAKLMPSIYCQDRTTIYAGHGEIVIQEIKKEKEND